MPSAQIEVVVSKTGETSIQTTGFNGQQCREATKDLEAVLGKKLSDRLTAEYHQTTMQENRIAGNHDNQS